MCEKTCEIIRMLHKRSCFITTLLQSCYYQYLIAPQPRTTLNAMLSYVSKHLQGDFTVSLSPPPNVGKYSTVPANLVLTPTPITYATTMSISKEETLSMVDPVEIKIPMPWGHVSGTLNDRP